MRKKKGDGGLMMGVPEFAKRFDYKDDTVRRWYRLGKIHGDEQDGKGKTWRIPEDAVPPQRKSNK